MVYHAYSFSAILDYCSLLIDLLYPIFFALCYLAGAQGSRKCTDFHATREEKRHGRYKATQRTITER